MRAAWQSATRVAFCAERPGGDVSRRRRSIQRANEAARQGLCGCDAEKASDTHQPGDYMPRLTVTFEKTAADRLERLAQGGRSKSDVIREALALEEVFQRAIADGSTVVIRSNNGQPEREIVRA